ncbi:unnamed protein product, partial [Ixodes hexagonus]
DCLLFVQGRRPDAGPQRTSKIARFIPRPQRVVARRLDDFTGLLPKPSPTPSPSDPLPPTSWPSSTVQSDYNSNRSVPFDLSEHKSIAGSAGSDRQLPLPDRESAVHLPDRRSRVVDSDSRNRVDPSHFKGIREPLDHRTQVVGLDCGSRVDPSHFKGTAEPLDYKDSVPGQETAVSLSEHRNFARLSGRRNPVVPSDYRAAATPPGDPSAGLRKQLRLGDRVIVAETKSGVLRFHGETQFADGVWCGVELDEVSGGKHSGIVEGIVYFSCRPGHGIFAPESKVRLQCATMLPELPAGPVVLEGDPPQPDKVLKGASLFSRLPKIGFPGRPSFPFRSKHKETDHLEEPRGPSEVVQRECKSAPTLFPTDHAPLWKGADLAGSPESDGDECVDRESAIHHRVSPDVLAELRTALLNELPPQQPAPDPSAAAKNVLSPIHENSDESDGRSGQKVVCGSPEEGAVAGAADFLSPIAELLDELDEGSKQDSLGILTEGAIRDMTLSLDGLSAIPNSFSTDDVADLPEEEEEGAVEATLTSCQAERDDDDEEDNVPMISSNVLRILQYNFPDQVDYLNTVVARSGAIVTTEASPLSGPASEASTSATDQHPDSATKRSATDSLECSSGFATSVGSVECDGPAPADGVESASNLTTVNLSNFHGDDGPQPKRPASAYTVRSTDTGFQGDSELEFQSEAGGTVASPCEDRAMRWSTCSSQDSGAVSESEPQRRNLHPDCCPDCGHRVASPAGLVQASLRLQAPASSQVGPQQAEVREERSDCKEEQQQEASGTDEAVALPEESAIMPEEDGEPQSESSLVKPGPEDSEVQASEKPVIVASDKDMEQQPGSDPAKAAACDKPQRPEKLVSKRTQLVCPPPPRPPKVVVSKVKAMIEASRAEGDEAARSTPRQPRKGRWDDVTSKLAASMADEKAKPKVKEVKSKVFTNLEGAKQAPATPRPSTLSSTVLRRQFRSSTSSRGSARTEADDATPTSEQQQSALAGTPESSTTAQDSSLARGMDAVSVQSSGKGPASVKSALSERKTKAPPKRPDYPRPWNTVAKPTAKESASMSRLALSRRAAVLSPTQPKSPCMPKAVHFSALPSTLRSQGEAKKGASSSTARGASSPVSGYRPKAGSGPAGHVPSQAEFTKEIQRLGALCESRTKELNLLKLQLRHASAGFTSFGVVIQHLFDAQQHDSFTIPKLSEELRKSREEIKQARAAIEQYKVEIEEMKSYQEERIEKMKRELSSNHAAKLRELEAAHKNELACYLECHTKKIEELKSLYTDIIETDRKSHLETMDALKQRHREKIDAINEEYTIELESINQDHAVRQAELESKHAELLQQYKTLQNQAKEFQDSVLQDTDTKIQWLSKKNKDLEKEVESLNVVLEMRSDQIQGLQRSKLEMERKEEELERCKTKMEKMEARIEDLQELLNEKVKLQSQLSVENAKLRETSEKQNRKLSRLDMHNEELIYKLRESANVSYVREGGQPRSRNSPQKRFSVNDPTAMSQSWHADRSRSSTGRMFTSTPHVHQQSQTLPRGQATRADEFPDNRKIRRSMSESSPPDDIQVQLFGACCERRGDDSVNEEADDGDSYDGPQCSQDDLLRLTWVKEDGELQNGAENRNSSETTMGSS